MGRASRKSFKKYCPLEDKNTEGALQRGNEPFIFHIGALFSSTSLEYYIVSDIFLDFTANSHSSWEGTNVHENIRFHPVGTELPF